MARAAPTRSRLWRHHDFLLLWGGQSISMLGSQVTVWALPFAAIFALHADPAQVGLLAAAGNLPLLLFGLFAGVLVDRLPRRPVLILADIGRALLLVTIPLAALTGRLTMTQLYAVAFLAGALGVAFEVAYRSYLPTLLQRDDLLAGNTRLAGSAQAAGTVGPGLAGALVQSVTAPVAILADALSFIVSAISLCLIHAREPAPTDTTPQPALLGELRDGLRAVLRHPLLRALAGTSGLFNLFDSMLMALYALYLTRTLGASAALAGLILTLAGMAGLGGVALSGMLPRRLGLGRTMLGAVLVAGAAELVIGLARGPLPVASAMVVVGEGLVQAADGVYGINAVTLRQALVPDRLQGRVNATVRVISVGAAPIGALLAAQLGQTYGVRPVVVLAGIGTLFAFLVVLFSPLRALHAHPSAPDEAAFRS